MQQRRGRGAPKEGGTPADGDGVKDAATADPSPPVQLRAPRHGGWKGFRGGGREAQMLRGEPGYHLGGCSKWYTGVRRVEHEAFGKRVETAACLVSTTRRYCKRTVPRSPVGPPRRRLLCATLLNQVLVLRRSLNVSVGRSSFVFKVETLKRVGRPWRYTYRRLPVTSTTLAFPRPSSAVVFLDTCTTKCILQRVWPRRRTVGPLRPSLCSLASGAPASNPFTTNTAS